MLALLLSATPVANGFSWDSFCSSSGDDTVSAEVACVAPRGNNASTTFTVDCWLVSVYFSVDCWPAEQKQYKSSSVSSTFPHFPNVHCFETLFNPPHHIVSGVVKPTALSTECVRTLAWTHTADPVGPVHRSWAEMRNETVPLELCPRVTPLWFLGLHGCSCLVYRSGALRTRSSVQGRRLTAIPLTLGSIYSHRLEAALLASAGVDAMMSIKLG